ncbi:hypothetical protein WKK05_41055 (plasmid) [Nostoc sp. UHCC 0302]
MQWWTIAQNLKTLSSEDRDGFTFMHPIEFKKKWQLTYNELALVLGYESEVTVRCWGRVGKNKRNPQQVVYVTCRLLDEKWSTQGKQVNSYL